MSTTPPVIKATETAVFQLRVPSAWKRAAIRDALKRTHLATAAVLKAALADFEQIQALPGVTKRKNRIQNIAYATLRTGNWNLSGAGAAAARVDAIGMVESYIQQLKERPVASPPTVSTLQETQSLYEQALDELTGKHVSLDRENELRDEIARLPNMERLRPLSLHGYGQLLPPAEASQDRRAFRLDQSPA